MIDAQAATLVAVQRPSTWPVAAVVIEAEFWVESIAEAVDCWFLTPQCVVSAGSTDGCFEVYEP